MPRTIGHGFLRSSQAATKIVFLAFSLRPSRLRCEGAVPLTAKTRRAQRNPRRRILSRRRRICGLVVWGTLPVFLKSPETWLRGRLAPSSTFPEHLEDQSGRHLYLPLHIAGRGDETEINSADRCVVVAETSN